MKLSNKTMEILRNEGGVVVTKAKKTTNKFGTFIVLTYYALYLKDGVVSAVSELKDIEIEGSMEIDIIRRFTEEGKY